MATSVYNFDIPSEYTLDNIQISLGASLVPGVLTGSARCDLFFKSYKISSASAVEVPNGGLILYGLEIDTVLKYWDGVGWVDSDGSSSQMNDLATFLVNVGSSTGPALSVVRPFIRLLRATLLDPSPVLSSLTINHLSQIPNKQTVLATDPDVAYDTGVGGVPSPGQTRVTLDPAQIQYSVGTNDLFVFLNGELLSGVYIEEDSQHVVFNIPIDNTGPTVDELEFRTATQGSSHLIPSPTFLAIAQPPERPDNFGGLFSFV